MSKSEGGWIGVEKTGNSTFTMASGVFDYYAAPYPGGLIRTYVNLLLDPASTGMASTALCTFRTTWVTPWPVEAFLQRVQSDGILVFLTPDSGV